VVSLVYGRGVAPYEAIGIARWVERSVHVSRRHNVIVPDTSRQRTHHD